MKKFCVASRYVLATLWQNHMKTYPNMSPTSMRPGMLNAEHYTHIFRACVVPCQSKRHLDLCTCVTAYQHYNACGILPVLLNIPAMQSQVTWRVPNFLQALTPFLQDSYRDESILSELHARIERRRHANYPATRFPRGIVREPPEEATFQTDCSPSSLYVGTFRGRSDTMQDINMQCC